MSVISGSIKGCTLVSSSKNSLGARKTYLLNINFAAYTGASDSGDVQDVGATIASLTASGKTNTTVAAMAGQPGVDTNGQAVYIGACTKSTDAFTFNLTSSNGTTELTSSTACKGCELFVTVTES